METNKLEIVKVTLFCMIGIIIFVMSTYILIPKWYYPDTTLPEATSRAIQGFYDEPKDSIDCIILGTSHPLYGIQAMELYREYGITSYNLSTCAQPMQVSYYLLMEALKLQHPKIVVMDISNIFGKDGSEAEWRYVIDNMKLSANKIKFAEVFNSRFENGTFINAIFPFFRYHDRWSSLNELDFTDFFRNRHFYCKGSYIGTSQYGAVTNEAVMNAYADEMFGMKDENVKYYVDGILQNKIFENQLYKPEINREHLDYLLRIKKICDDNDIQLLLIKVPALSDPMYYDAAWTQIKSDIARDLCAKYDIDYFDIMYDEEGALIDWATDTYDYGSHMNIQGGIKVTTALGDYLVNKYGLVKSSYDYSEKDLQTYEIIRSISLLETETDFNEYINKLVNEFQKCLIIISASDNMVSGLSERDKTLLADLGLEMSFDDSMLRNSYIAVVDNGCTIYESASNRTAMYEGFVGNTNYKISSKGFYLGSGSSIRIGDKEYSVNRSGINIVVFDKEYGLVLDSVNFGTFNDEKKSFHSQRANVFLREVESYLIEQ